MSKPRSRLVGKADHELRTVRGFTTVIHFGKQAKHLAGQPNAGTGTWNPESTRETIDFGIVIGMSRDLRSGRCLAGVFGSGCVTKW